MIDSLDLRNLWIPDFDVPEVCARRVAREAEQQQFKEKYGERWKDAYFAELKRRDAIEHRKGDQLPCLWNRILSVRRNRANHRQGPYGIRYAA